MTSRNRLTDNLKNKGILNTLWDYFWNVPVDKCPKCGSTSIEYYDPFFFNPIRTLRGRRRIKCLTCRFIWRPRRKANSYWGRFLPRY